MTEKMLSRYYRLGCGHFTPTEVELLYRVFGDGTQVMCERCGDFRDIAVKEKVIVPDEPLF